MENRNAARFLAFDSLKGLKEAIQDADDNVSRVSATLKSEDEKQEMDYMIYRSYIKESMLYISYIKKGTVYEIIGSVIKIDALKHVLWLSGGKKISLAQITSIREA